MTGILRRDFTKWFADPWKISFTQNFLDKYEKLSYCERDIILAVIGAVSSHRYPGKFGSWNDNNETNTVPAGSNDIVYRFRPEEHTITMHDILVIGRHRPLDIPLVTYTKDYQDMYEEMLSMLDDD